MKPRLLRRTLIVLTVFGLAALPATGVRADFGSNAAERLARMKQAQQQRLMSEPFAERREAAERIQKLKKKYRKQIAAGQHIALKPGERLRPEVGGERDEGARRESRAARAARLAGVATPASTASLSSNLLVNNPNADLDPSSTAQSEVSIAADGQNMVVTWNDGDGLNFFPYTNSQGYGWSTDGGLTWTDGGSPPTPVTNMIWFSDPVVMVNPKTHKFYFSALYLDPNNLSTGNNGVAVVPGTFGAGSFSWGTPVSVVSGSAANDIYDKEWMAVDTLTNNVYVSYVHFFSSGDQIEFKRSTDAGVTFGSAVVLSALQDQGFAQAPRVVLGPAGEVYVAWYAIGNGSNSAWGRDYYRLRKSVNSGLTFGTQATIDSLFVDWGNGAPGFNRGNSFAFPSLAVDNTSGAHRGRVYVTWNESPDIYNSRDNIGYRPTSILEPPDFGGSAGAAKATTVGDRIRGTISPNDEDWFKFTGTKDSTLIVYSDSLTSTLTGSIQIFAADGVTELAYVASQPALAPMLVVFTLPQTGTYYMRMTGLSSSSGSYTIWTGYHRPSVAPENDRARDHRDIFLKYADNPSGAWPATTVRVNGNPADFDDWLPEVAVGGNGKPYVAWYDFHDYGPAAFPGSGSTTYLSRSDDGGATWLAGSPVSSVTTYWSSVASNIAPNQGDYICLVGTPTALLVGWADGRGGSPDVYFSNVDLAFVAVSVSLASAVAHPDRVDLTWQVSDKSSLSAVLERRSTTSGWNPIADLTADGSGHVTYSDLAVTPGRWGYRLTWTDNGTTNHSDEAWVEVPATSVSFALRAASPNPSNGELKVSFTLPEAAPATLVLVDVSGRELSRIEVGSLGPGTHVADLASGRRLAAGLYLVRLTQGSRHTVLRASIVP
jgi:Bacterial pre-peptidase C-terminal domain